MLQIRAINLEVLKCLFFFREILVLLAFLCLSFPSFLSLVVGFKFSRTCYGSFVVSFM